MNEYLPIFVGDDLPEKGWDTGMYCLETDAVNVLRSNLQRGFVSSFAFVVVDKGWMTIYYNGRELTFHPNDLYTYSPGLPVDVIATSDDFHGYCLMADEHVTIEAPSVHGEVLRMLYSIFLLDLQNAQQRAIRHRQTPQRVEEIFIGFTRLLPRYFVEHHDIAFYADRLHISTVYLSRVVRQVTGRTVVDYINQMLLMEASFLLQTSQMSITQIADHLHFADTPSFSKFFSRLKGMSPKDYRKG